MLLDTPRLRGVARLGCAIGLIWFAVAGVLLVGSNIPAQAASSPSVSASFTPSSIELASGRSRNVVLRISDDGKTPVSGVRVTFTSDPGITVQQRAAPSHLAVGASGTTVATVFRSVGAPAMSSVEATITYTRMTEADSLREAVVARLVVTTPAVPSASVSPIVVTTSIGSATLIQYQSTDVFFKIANSSDRRQRLTSVVATYPEFLTVGYLPVTGARVHGDGRLRVTGIDALGPGDATVVHLHIDASQPLQPGDALIVLTVSAQDQIDHSTTTTVASQKIAFSVLGESGVLQLLGVPALLFVPGLVFVLVLWALWSYVFPRRSFSISGGLGLEGKVVMWVFALLPSLAFPFLYPIVTDLFGPRRDYRKAYGLDDILYVWLMAAVAAIVVWAIWVLAGYSGNRLFVPAEGDLPRILLLKYARRPWSRTLKRDTALYDNAQLVVVLRRRGDAPLVTPQIAYQSISLSPGDILRLNGYIPDKPLRLWWFLRQHHTGVTLGYATSAPISGPTHSNKAKLGGWSEGNLVQT